jgi:hypothetical protein
MFSTSPSALLNRLGHLTLYCCRSLHKAQARSEAIAHSGSHELARGYSSTNVFSLARAPSHSSETSLR